jgi:hypothetical protein
MRLQIPDFLAELIVAATCKDLKIVTRWFQLPSQKRRKLRCTYATGVRRYDF